MATPRGSIHRDVEQRLRDIEKQLRTLTGVSLYRTQLGVSAGDFIVAGGGDVLVQDGGSIETKSPGEMRWRDEADRIRVEWGTGTEPTTGTRLQAFYFKDTTGNGRVTVGEILLTDTNTVTTGILVEDASQQDHLRAWPGQSALQQYSGAASIGLRVFENLGETWLHTSTGHGIRMLNTDPGVFFFRRPGDTASGLKVEVDTTSTSLMGGDLGGSLATRLVLHPSFEVRAMDGAGDSYVDMAASAFVVRTSSAETKDLLGDVEAGALEKVRATPIRRWRHKAGPTSSDGEGVPAPARIGPMVEDSPAELLNHGDPNGGIDLAASVWTLWAALQEQADMNDRQAQQIADLTARLDRLEQAA